MLKLVLQAPLLGLLCCLVACASAPLKGEALDAQLDQLVSMLVGDYLSRPDEGAYTGRPIYQKIRAISPPEGYRRALYSELRHDGSEGDLYRQLVLVFDERPERDENRMIAYGVVDKEAAKYLIQTSTLLADGVIELKPPLSETCYTIWTRQGDAFEGYIDPARCLITGKREDKRRIESRTRISRDSIGQLERGFSETGELLFGNAEDTLSNWPRVSAR